VVVNRWEHDQYTKAQNHEEETRQSRQPSDITKPDEKAREAFGNSAKEIREKKTWRPTWQALGLNYDRASLWKNGKKGEDSTGSSS
jgi:large subunit ribosomal protein L23